MDLPIRRAEPLELQVEAVACAEHAQPAVSVFSGTRYGKLRQPFPVRREGRIVRNRAPVGGALLVDLSPRGRG